MGHIKRKTSQQYVQTLKRQGFFQLSYLKMSQGFMRSLPLKYENEIGSIFRSDKITRKLRILFLLIASRCYHTKLFFSFFTEMNIVFCILVHKLFDLNNHEVFPSLSEIEDLPHPIQKQLFDELLDRDVQKGKCRRDTSYS